MPTLSALVNFQTVAAILSIIIGIYFIWYNFVSKKPKFIHKNTQMIHDILSRLKKAHRVYYPSFWMVNAHLNTIFSELVREKYSPQVKYDREILKAEDGGTLALDWIHHDTTLDFKTPTAFIYPGVTGHSQVSYVREIATHLTQLGYRIVCLNQRGINCDLTSPKISCAAYTGDISLIIDHLGNKYPDALLFGVAYSMGANILLKHIGKTKSTKLDGVVSVSNPLDFTKSASVFKNFLPRKLYSEHLCRGALKMIKKHEAYARKNDMIDFEEVMKVKTLYELDEKFTSRIYGYKNADAYYDDACSSKFINEIQIPTLILNAYDDPFVCPTCLEHDNTNILMMITEHGGHLGFSEGTWPSEVKNWSVEVIGEYLDALKALQKSK